MTETHSDYERIKGEVEFWNKLVANTEILDPSFVVADDKFKALIPAYEHSKNHWASKGVLIFSVEYAENGDLNGFYHNFYDFLLVSIYQIVKRGAIMVHRSGCILQL